LAIARSYPSEWWMIRSVWLAFGFLVFIGALAAFKAGVATPSRQQAGLAEQALAEAAIEPEVARDALVKADRLDDTPDKKPVQAIAIVPPPQAVPKLQEKPTKIISRHWRDSYAKVKKRKHHRHHATRTKKHRAHRR
jgi:hypothetical protein